MVYDCIVIGAGPAGLAAAIYLARQKLNFIILTGNVGGQTLWSADVENYLGFHLLDGTSLIKQFRKHLDDYAGAFELRENEKVTSVAKAKQGFEVKTATDVYLAKTVLIATGARHRELDVPGEKEFYGKGVSYCATCDAPLYKGKNVHVIGGGNSAMDAALFLAKYAKQVTVLSVNPALQGDRGMVKSCTAAPNIRFVGQARAVRITGDGLVNGIVYADGQGREAHEPTQGIFIEVGLLPVADFVTQAEKDKGGEIIVDKQNATSVPGMFAAGDVTDVAQKQIAVAVGEGSKAALGIIQYLQTGR